MTHYTTHVEFIGGSLDGHWRRITNPPDMVMSVIGKNRTGRQRVSFYKFQVYKGRDVYKFQNEVMQEIPHETLNQT